MAGIEGDVSLPGGKKVPKKAAYIGGALALGYVGWRWYTASTADTGPAAGTGIYTTPDQTEIGDSATGGSLSVGGNTGSTSADGTNPNAVNTNADWTQRAADVLASAGYDQAVVYAALGEFIARRSLDPAEATIALAALAAMGQPPIGGPYSVIEEAATGTGTLPAPTNLRSGGSSTDTVIRLKWDAVPGAGSYRIFRTDLGSEPIGTSIDTVGEARGLTPNKSYSFYVVAVSTANKPGGKSSIYSGKTSARTLSAPHGFKAANVTRTSFRIAFPAVPGAEFYRWAINGNATSPTDQPFRDFTGLRPNTTYTVVARADVHTQNPGPLSGNFRIKTKR